MSTETGADHLDHLADIDAILQKQLNYFFTVFLITGTLSLIGSLVRVFQFGWLFQQIIHTGVYIGIIVVFIVFKNRSVKTVALILFSLVGIDAIANLFAFGLSSTGTLMLGYTIIMITTFIGYNAGRITMVITILILSAFAAGICSHVIPSYHDVQRYVTSWSTWITQISTFIVMMATAIISTSAIKLNLLNSLQNLRERTLQLTETNKNLVQSERKIGTIINTAPEAIITTSLDGTVASCNQQACILLNYTSQEELVGNNIFTHILSIHEQRIREILSNALKQNTVFRDVEFMVHTRTKKEIPVKMSANILNDQSNTPIGYLAIIQDITKAKELEEHLRQSDKMEAIGQLSGGIAHDFNNQLTGILGFAELLKINLSNDKENLDDVLGIIRTVEKASSLTAQLLAFSRKGIHLSAPFDLHQIIRDVNQLLHRTLDPSISIIISTNAKNPIIHGDAAQLQNAILNLALNSRDAMQSGGTITISTSGTGNSHVNDIHSPTKDRQNRSFIMLSVKDTGSGMDEETQKHIFEPFFTTKAPDKGTGMGLANVYRTIINHGGTIEVFSKPGVGTEVEIVLPEFSTFK